MQVTFNIPDLAGISERDTKIMLAGQLYKRGHISLGKAAEIAGYSKSTFMEIMGDYGIEMLPYTVEDLEHDLTVLGIKV